MDTVSSFVYRILFLGAVVCVTASANLMLDYNWPAPDPNINRYPHESSCHYYYLMLSEEDITIEKCPDGQLFDYLKHSCISDTEHVHCWSRHFGKIKHGHITKHRKHFKCPYPWGKYPNLHDCRKYHLCLNGKSSVKKCAPFELFDKVSRKCIASINAICADRTDVVEHGYVCPKMWGSFTYSKDCSKYYECLQKKPSLRTCQKSHLFDDRLGKCAPKQHVYCGLRRNPYEKVTSDAPKTSKSPKYDQKPITPEIGVTTISTAEKITSPEPVSQENKPTLPEIPSSIKEVTSTPRETFKEVTSTNHPTAGEVSSLLSVAEESNKEAQLESSTTKVEVEEKQQETSDVFEEVSEGKEFVEVSNVTENVQTEISSQTASDGESGDLKKDVSTEERGMEVVSTKLASIAPQENEITSESAATAISKTVCHPEDSMCTTEKDGTVVKCSSSKDIQPHPKDERRFLDCTGSKIHIYTCPPNLTFFPKNKKCRWQFIMGAK